MNWHRTFAVRRLLTATLIALLAAAGSYAIDANTFSPDSSVIHSNYSPGIVE